MTTTGVRGFEDPIAAKTQWTPLVPGGSNFATHTLVVGEDSRAEFKPTLGLRAFGAVFLITGVGCSVGGLLAQQWFMALFGLPFAAVGVFVLKPKTLLFDGSARMFTGPKGQVPFGSIHALQLIKEHVSGDDSDYWSYELNLVLTNGERVNVVDHGKLARVRADAQTLSAMLGCKLWDTGP